MNNKKKLYVIDASGFIYKAYYAITHMLDTKGRSTNALFGFIKSINYIISDFSPNYLVIVFDGKANKKSRTEIYSEYKGNRQAIPEDLPQQILWSQEFCSLKSIPFIVSEGVEADDAMGSIAKWAEKHDFETYLCTNDKDFCQLVNDSTFILNNNNNVINADGVKERYGINPSQMIDYLAIVGDTSDNVPGIPGFGPKTARALLQEFTSLENIVDHFNKSPVSKKQKIIQEYTEQAFLSKRLVSIDCNIDIPLDEHFYILNMKDSPDLEIFYKDKSFASFLKTHTPKHTNASYQVVDTEESLNTLTQKLNQAKEIAFHLIHTNSNILDTRCIGVGLAIESNMAWYVPTNGKLGNKYVINALKPIFENENIGFYGHDIKFEKHVLANHSIQITNTISDTMIASYLLNADEKNTLEYLALKYLNETLMPIVNIIGKGKKTIDIQQVSISDISQYCCHAVDTIFKLKQIFTLELSQRSLESIFKDIELPLIDILMKIERMGIFLEKQELEEMSRKICFSIQTLEKEIYELAGEEFKINSPKQLSNILFNKLKIHPPKKTATGFSTDAEVLESLKDKHPIAEKILHYRLLEKLRSTYIETLPREINSQTGRIHCTFTQAVAATGRLACKNPNLQNIPTRSEEGKQIRHAFKPEKNGWYFLSADYSQIELRLLAHMSEDKSLIEAFMNGEDIHTFTASLIFDIPTTEISQKQRYMAKTVNFGIIYGQQAFGLAKELKISLKEAEFFIHKYFQRYPGVKNFMEICKQYAMDKGKTHTLIGRERIINNINSKNAFLKSAAERLAINSPIQGTAADLIKLAMIKVDNKIRKHHLHGFVVLQIHDELIFETPYYEIEELTNLVRKSMESVFSLKIPLKVNISIGKNWKEC